MIFDRRIFWPAFMQIFALLAPFFYLRAAIGHGSAATIQGETVLSIVGFAAIAIDFSASTFLAKSQARLLRSGALSSILVGRLSIASILLLVYIVFRVGTGDSWQNSILVPLVCMLLGLILDPSWIYIGRGHLWIPAAIGIVRYGSAALLTICGIQPTMALAASFFSSSFLFLFISGIRLGHFTRVSPQLFYQILRRYYNPTLTESITAVFSRLDVAVAAALLPPSDALVYIVSRKLILGLQSIAFSSARIFYLERDDCELIALRRALMKHTLLTFTFGFPLSIFIAVSWFNLKVNDELFGTLAILSMLLFLGYIKILTQFGHLYVHQKFLSDLLYSLAALLSFICASWYLFVINNTTAIAFAFARIVPDAVYIIMAKTQMHQES